MAPTDLAPDSEPELDDHEQLLLDALQMSRVPLTRMDLERLTRLRGFQVAKALGDLRKAGLVERRRSKWLAVEPREAARIAEWPDPAHGLTVRRRRDGVVPSPGTRGASVASERPTDWNAFRNLCLYYVECLEYEGGGSAKLDQSNDAASFTELNTVVDWQALASGLTASIPASAEVREFMRGNAATGGERRLRLAGPVELVDGRKGVRQLLPVFLLTVRVILRPQTLELKAEGEARVNEAWLETRFPRSRQDLREDLLIRLGFFHEEEVEDGVELVALEGSSVQQLWMRLFDISSEEFQELGGPDRPQTNPSLPRLRTPGLYNRVLLLPAAEGSFTVGLQQELRKLAKKPDQELDGTALAPLFAPKLDPKQLSEIAENRKILPEFQPLNAEQREAVAASFEQPILAIQGPPGTGKSTVVTHVLTAHALAGMSVLFGSRNHRALEAVVPRLQAIYPDRPLIMRLTKSAVNTDETGDDWLQQVLGLISRTADPEGLEELERCREVLDSALQAREGLEVELTEHLEMAQTLGELESTIHQIIRQFGERRSGHLRLACKGLDEDSLRVTAERLSSAQTGILSRLRRWYVARRFRRDSDQLIASLDTSAQESLRAVESLADLADLLANGAQLASCFEERSALEARSKVQRERSELVQSLADSDESVQDRTRIALETLAKTLGADLDPALRQRLVDLRGELGSRRTAGQIHRLKSNQRQVIQSLFKEITRVIPLWACSNLSIRSRVPLTPAAFDLVVIDEASQCDIASCLPLLYRAKRAMIVGDPMQLRHVGKVGREVEDRMRALHGVEGGEFGRFRYSTNSIWDPALAVTQGDRGLSLMLKEHWRCHPAIADYFSKLFYSGKLRVRTPAEQYAPVVRGQRKLRGIEWTDVPGGSESTPGGSRFHQPQIDAIVAELERVAETGYDGTVGVVTPFRAHANRIRDAVAQRLPAELLKKWNFDSQTADGFQGDERDLILLGLIGGPVPGEVPMFYARDRNRFNVAVSRARSLLHVFGDLAWAESCSADTLAGLVKSWRNWQEQAQRPVRSELIGPVWEPLLAAAMRRAGIEFHQQYPACGFYLDFGLLHEGLKLDVEVDGESYHRNASGARKIEDLRRDQILIAAGWRVVRFWVYQLREDMDGCVAEIESIVRAGG